MNRVNLYRYNNRLQGTYLSRVTNQPIHINCLSVEHDTKKILITYKLTKENIETPVYYTKDLSHFLIDNCIEMSKDECQDETKIYDRVIYELKYIHDQKNLLLKEF